MASAAEKRRYTPAEYLALERKAETKSEYFDGEIFAMSGVSREHSLLALNLASYLHGQLSNGPCETHVSDMRVRVSPTGLYTYPDIVAVCDEPRFEDDQVDTLLNPTLVVEVLSPSTEAYDRGRKFAHYRRIETLREYVLISQEAVLVERYSRREDGWLLTNFGRRDDAVPLESVGVEVPLRAVYARVDVPDGEAEFGPGPAGGPRPLEPTRNPR
jgi:Uma2 family endonuclease